MTQALNVRAILPIAVLVTVSSGCAQYRQSPLEVTPSALSVPDLAILRQDAIRIERPYLRPVAVDFSQPLDGNAIAVVAILTNSELKALRQRAGVADAQVFAAGLLPDPTFSFGIDHVISGPVAVDNIAGGLGLNLNALRTRSAVRAQAQATARQVRLDLAWAEWQTAGQARVQAARVLGLQRTTELATQSRDSSQSLLDRMLRAAGRGDLSPDQLQAARLAAFDAADRLRGYERDLGTARLELLRLMGLPPTTQLRLSASEPSSSIIDADRLFRLASSARLDLAALQAGYDAQEAVLRKAVLDQFPTLDLSLNAARDTGRNGLIGPGIAFTLPLWNRNRGGIAIERATREALKAEYTARLAQTRADIFAAAQAIAILRGQRAALLAGLPAIERFASASSRAASRGDLALATAETARAALRDKQSLLVQAEQALAEQAIALELLTGTLRESWPQ